MTFNLEYSGFYSGIVHNGTEHLVTRIKIADSERAHFTCFYGFFHILPCTYKISDRLMHV